MWINNGHIENAHQCIEMDDAYKSIYLKKKMENNYNKIRDKFNVKNHKQIMISLIWETFKTDIIKNIFIGITLEVIVVLNMWQIK